MNKTIELPFIEKLKSNLESRSGLIQVVVGPRQVGKTTTIENHLIPKYQGKIVSYSADRVFNSSDAWLMEIWNKALGDKLNLIIIDEIQKCENWSEVIKKLWDKKRKDQLNLDCILLGSSSLEIQKGLTESLTGRYQQINLYQWNFKESHKAYGLNFEQFLKFGGYPGSYQFLGGHHDWIDYVKRSILGTVIEKDILHFSRVKSPSLFKQAFEIITSYPCHEISYTKLLGQIQDKGNVDLVKYYISLFEGAFLIKALQKFSLNKIKLKASSPKILVMAPAIYYVNIQDEYTPEERGYVFESIVGAQLVRTGEDLYYWRKGDFELDFVIKKGRTVFGIEVKSGKKKKAKSMIQFLKEYPSAKAVYIDMDNYQEFENNPMGFLTK